MRSKGVVHYGEGSKPKCRKKPFTYHAWATWHPPMVTCKRCRSWLDKIGVEDSTPMRILGLMNALGYVLHEVKDVDHPSRVSMVFDEKTHFTTITYEDTLPDPLIHQQDGDGFAACGADREIVSVEEPQAVTCPACKA